MKHMVVLTWAGISVESSIKNFRDAYGLCEGHNVMEVASPQGFAKNPELVLNFYNERRRQLLTVNPNEAHNVLASLESDYEVSIITQNVDDLHERAGSSNIIHLHGELLKIRSSKNLEDVRPWTKDLNLGDLCEKGHQLRPHIVWFGEDVPMIEPAMDICETADILVIIGTSMQVYPAAGLISFVPNHVPIYYIDPNPAKVSNTRVTIIPETATKGVKKLLELLSSK